MDSDPDDKFYDDLINSDEVDDATTVQDNPTTTDIPPANSLSTDIAKSLDMLLPRKIHFSKLFFFLDYYYYSFSYL